MREEKDSLGKIKIKKEALYGIHTQRALENFPTSGLPKHLNFYRALAQVKLAAAQTNLELKYIEPDIGNAIIKTCKEMIEGQHMENFVVDALQGGAGTSTNMNINEIIANRAGQLLNKELGTYFVSPFNHVNLHQSTNDVYPTALKIAIYYYLQDLEQSTNELLIELQNKEQQFANIVKLGRTELQPAIPTTLGKTFSAYAEALGRDRWRIFKAQERIRQINIGGTAIGTGVTAPKKYVLQVSRKLKEITGLPIARAENLVDATQNQDQIAEAFAMIKILAINLEKIANDLRLMNLLKEIQLPNVQVGSSIMPGKYNPVIPEMVISVAKKVIGNELIATSAIANGELELNAFLPLVAQTIFESLDLLIQATQKLKDNCIINIKAHDTHCLKHLIESPTITTLLVEKIGYQQASEIAQLMTEKHIDIYQAVKELDLDLKSELETALKPEKILGFNS